MELKFESGLWVKTILSLVSNGTDDSNHNNTEIPADPQEDQVSLTSIKVVAARSKAKAKPQREPVDTTTTIPMHERRWIDIESSEQTLAAYDLSIFSTRLKVNAKKHRSHSLPPLSFASRSEEIGQVRRMPILALRRDRERGDQ